MRTVVADDLSIPTINVKYRFATVIGLPAGEVIEDFVYGDTDHWSFNGYKGGHFCYVIPTKKVSKLWDGQTNIHLVTKDGKDWAFHLEQVSGQRFDSKVMVQDAPPPKPISTCDVGLRLELTTFKNESTLRQAAYHVQIDTLKNEVDRRVIPVEFVASLDDDYHIGSKLRAEPFNVTKVYSQGKNTYIRSKAQPQAAFYEMEGKKKVHVNYDYRDGVYVVPGTVHEGCLGIGKQEACFKKKG